MVKPGTTASEATKSTVDAAADTAVDSVAESTDTLAPPITEPCSTAAANPRTRLKRANSDADKGVRAQDSIHTRKVQKVLARYKKQVSTQRLKSTRMEKLDFSCPPQEICEMCWRQVLSCIGVYPT